MGERLNLAMVGCGAIAELHLMGIGERASRTRITAAVDPVIERAQKLAERTGAKPFASLTDALRDGDFDAVDLMVPHHVHEPVALEAFAARKHVLLEKPMATSVAGCERILEAARSAETVFMVGENAQYWPEVVRAGELIEQGAIGDVIAARASVTIPVTHDDPFYGGEKPWRFDREAMGGGVALDVGSHWIRPLRMWLGEIDEVVAGLGYPAERMEGESLARAILRFRSGVLATFEATLVTDGIVGPDAMFRITGSAGEIVIDSTMGGRLVLYDSEHPSGLKEEPQGYLESYGPEFEDFERAVLDGTPLAAGPETAVGELRVALAMYRSAETRRWEKVWD